MVAPRADHARRFPAREIRLSGGEGGRKMKWRVLFFLILTSVLAGAQEAQVRTSIASQEELWVGQRATLVVELLAPGFFSGTPSFDLPNAPGLLIVPPSGSPVVSNETINDT